MKKQTRITDKDRIEILQFYEECQNISEVARKFNNWSYETIRQVIKTDSDISRKLKQKKQECVESTLEYMEKLKETKKNVLEKLLKGIELKMEDFKAIDKMNIRDLATAYGIIMDKELKAYELQKGNVNKQELSKVEELLTKIEEEANR